LTGSADARIFSPEGPKISFNAATSSVAAACRSASAAAFGLSKAFPPGSGVVEGAGDASRAAKRTAERVFIIFSFFGRPNADRLRVLRRPVRRRRVRLRR
jgi:hypothetical protein